MQAAIPDLIRLVAVPVLGWAAIRDLRTRRVPNGLWLPLAVLGLVLLAWDGYLHLGSGFGFRLYVLRVGLSLGIVVPLAYVFWFLGGFGGADAKAFMVLALLFPTYPSFELLDVWLPIVVSDLGVFSLSVLTNTVLIALGFPLVLGVRNVLRGDFSMLMFFGHRVPVGELPVRYGTFLETPAGYTRSGLDLDALRMYLRWRGVDLETLRENPALKDPETLPAQPNDPTDGAVEVAESGESTLGSISSGGVQTREGRGSNHAENEKTDPGREMDDPWGAETFLDDIETSAYGTTPTRLRDGLDLVASADAVWVSPGIPFIVPTFVGLLVALTLGDVLFYVLGLLGLV